MTSNTSTPLASFLSGLLAGNNDGGSSLEVVVDNAKSHCECALSNTERRRRMHLQLQGQQGSVPKGISRWQSTPCHAASHSHHHDTSRETTDAATNGAKPTLRRPRRSRSSDAEKAKLSQERFTFDGAAKSDEAQSEKTSSPKQPRRQVTPDINYDFEKAMKARAMRKPERQLTPPNSGEKQVTRRVSPTTAMIPERRQFVRQGSID